MKIKLTKLAVAFLALFGLTSVSLAPATYADTICDNPNISEEVKKSSGCSGGSSTDLSTVIGNILKAVIGIAGLVAAVYIVIGGVQYITSTGDSGKIAKAKNTILYALIGLVVCALAFAIVNWAIGAISGTSTSGNQNNTQQTQQQNTQP